ncbi:MHS family alpha-ketoglutarate permease-like MFS transporter [Arthrobacter oryzae]|uniref:MFS transporter n=1 Tax=Arthrobacter TaxID=1663 RepID=UPI00278A9595|nr:MFS transporter [Arthrobacter oryzae]MDP9986074.1 MHS family alpha-ketoglutarate permease-like MFS transporter [Arthrobacter oryzae]
MSVITAAPPVSRTRQLAAATVGNIVEWFDWYVYSMLALYFSSQFFPKTGDPIVPLLSAMAIFAVGFFMRPLGGLLGGMVADRLGRKKALTATVMLMGIGSLLVALAPTYDQVGVLSPVLLVLARLLQGLSTGGEFAASSTFLVESAPEGRRGFFSSFLYIGATLGNVVAIGSVAVLVAVLPDDAMHVWGWRVPFAIGTLGAVAGLFIRRFAEETLAVADADTAGHASAKTSRPSAFEFMRTHPKECVLVFAINAAPTLFFYVFSSYLPTYAHITVGFDMKNALFVGLISLTYLAILQPLMGILSDRIGRKPLLLAFGGGFTLLTIPLLNALQDSFLSLLLVQMAALTLLACYTSITSAVMCELFPARIRAAGIGLPYALGVALVGGTGPYVATWLADVKMIDAFGWYLTILAAITTVVFLRVKESYKTGLPQ